MVLATRGRMEWNDKLCFLVFACVISSGRGAAFPAVSDFLQMGLLLWRFSW
jgi:hypothetical protein